MLRPLALAAALALAASPVAAQSYKTPEAAASVVRNYYRAIGRGWFRAAYTMWDRDGQASGKSYAAFVQGFARTATSNVRTGTPTNGEGAAGSAYIDVPVDVTARLKNGRTQHFVGSYTLRRVNDVDGATEVQRTWHLSSATLRAVR